MPAEALSNTESVLRVVRLKSVFVPEGALLPLPEAFRPTSDDEKEAEEHGHPVRLSVWDLARTTPAQAIRFRNLPEDEPLPRVYKLKVEAIMELAMQCGNDRVRIVRYPATGIPDAEPGADGHCGIEGLDYRTSAEKFAVKKLRAALAASCEPVAVP